MTQKPNQMPDAKYMSFTKSGKPDGMKAVKKMASGGSASSRADGCCVKGKTKGAMVAMCGGGMSKKK